MSVRTVVFWLHLLTALTAGAVILTMAVTGALLAFEPQIVEWAERDLWRAAPPTLDAARLPLATIVARAQERRGGERATTVSMRPDPRSSVRVGFGREGALYMNPYTGDVVGPGSRTHDVMHVIEDWHRWLGSRDLGRPVTGDCNLAFLGLACTGRRPAGEAEALDLDALSARAARQLPQWVTLTLRLPQRPGGPVTAFIQEPSTWHPSPRSVLTLQAASAEVVRWEPFSGANTGRRLRLLARVLHTGEVGGVVGQLIAGLASAGGAMLVYTGVSLGWRRVRAWGARGPRLADPSAEIASTP